MIENMQEKNKSNQVGCKKIKNKTLKKKKKRITFVEKPLLLLRPIKNTASKNTQEFFMCIWN